MTLEGIGFYFSMKLLKTNFLKGHIGYTPEYVGTLAGKQKSIAILNNKVYDFSTYLQGGRLTRVKPGDSVPDGVNTKLHEWSSC